MTTRRKSKRSVSLRSSSFIRLISPFRGKNLEQEAGEEGVGSVLGAALSDSHLNVSCKSTDSWRVSVDNCDREKNPHTQNTARRTERREEVERAGSMGRVAGSGDLTTSTVNR